MSVQEMTNVRDTVRTAIHQIEEHLLDQAIERQRAEIAKDLAASVERRFFMPESGRCLPQNNPNAGVVHAFPKGRWA